ncbi:putative sensor protein [Leptolyngbya sp. NIES-3755]|nr:putative sensor protein [Leptolyngbya sp. NIES-3755]
MPSISIRQALPILIITPFLIATGITAAIQLEGNRRVMTDFAKQLTNRAGQQIDNRILSYLQRPQVVNQTLNNSDRSSLASLSNLSRLEDFFWQQTQDASSLIYPSYGDEQGNFVGVEMIAKEEIAAYIKDASTGTKRDVYRLDKQGNRTEKIESIDYDPRTRPWYIGAKESGKAAWSPIYVSKSGVMMIAATTPIYNTAQQLQGVLAYNLPLSELSDLLRTTNLSRTGQMFVLERDGTLVATSSGVPIVERDGKLQRLSISQSDNPLIKTTSQELSKRLGEFQQVKSSQFIEFEFNGQTQFAEVEPIQDERGIDWLLVMVVPESDFMGSIEANTRSSLMIAFALAGLASLLGLTTARWIIRPIEKIIQTAQDIEAQRFDTQRLEEVKTRSDEIGQLARVFEQMTDIVYARERQLQTQLKDLQNQSNQAQGEATEEQYFQQLLERAKAVRGAK